MNAAVDLKPVLAFLSNLQENNNRAWFEANRSTYDTAREQFEVFVEDVIQEMRPWEDLQGVAAKDCLFRIYRDIRFSRDKSPYKTSMAASIAPGGRHSWRQAYYLHLEPHDRSIAAGGLHMPASKQLSSFRDLVLNEPGELLDVLADPDFRTNFGEIKGEKLATAPRGISTDHPHIELLRLKEAVAIRSFADGAVLAGDFLPAVVGAFRAMKPFLDLLNERIPPVG